MPFGSFFKKAFTKGAANLAKQCGAGDGVVDMVEDAVEGGFDQVSYEHIMYNVHCTYCSLR